MARSATVPTQGQSSADVLESRRRVWEQRPLTREIYRRYFESIRAQFAPGRRTIELGGGAGNSRDFLPEARVSDIVLTPFVHFVADAARLPIADASADNLFMVDVLHHLPHPARMFREAVRVLRPGGRLIMLEPNISAFSRLVFAIGHPERVDPAADPLPIDDSPVFTATGPFASNQAIPSRIFFRDLQRFEKMFPELRVKTRQLDSVIAYPLSGGFSGPNIVPRFAHGLLWQLERALSPLKRWMAFRLLVTLEKQ